MSQMNPRTAEALQRLGGSTGGSMTRDYYFVYSLFIPAVAVGGNGKADSLRIDAGVDFMCKQIQVSANLTPVAANTPAGYAQGHKLLRWMEVDAAAANGLVGVGLHQTRIQIASNDRPWFNIPARLDLVSGDTNQPGWMPDPVFLAGNDNLLVTCFNDLPNLTGPITPTVDFFISLVGVKMSRR